MDSELFKPGDKVEQVVMGWPGVITLDLRDNPFTAYHWEVHFNQDGKLLVSHVYQTEIKHRSE